MTMATGRHREDRHPLRDPWTYVAVLVLLTMMALLYVLTVWPALLTRE